MAGRHNLQQDYSGAKISVGTRAKGYDSHILLGPFDRPSGSRYMKDRCSRVEGATFWRCPQVQMPCVWTATKGAIKSEERMLKGEFGRIRDVRGVDGSIYMPRRGR